mgnify:CR=1 FL=1
MKTYYVYLLASQSRTLYIGVTSNLSARVRMHKAGRVPGFTKKYGVDQLVYFEKFCEVTDAIAREKQLKGWRRSKKTNLIEQHNPGWRDLFYDWPDLAD